jgi:hypothetical protein
MMKSTFRKLSAIELPEFTLPLVLLGVCILAYGMFANRVGFYWDDWPMNWIAQKLGPDGLTRYFATNRPFWGMLYTWTTPILGGRPLTWQLFAIFWRWTGCIALWGLLRQTWPERPNLAAWGAILFAVYPGFKQQWISLLYSHFFIILTAFLLSYFLTILALRKPRWFWPLTAAALVLSFVNLLTMEYFFLLELGRVVFIWFALAGEIANWKERLRRTFLAWLPYLALFLGVTIWRAFFFKFQTTNYKFSLMTQLKAQPLLTIAKLAALVLHDIGLATAGAWITAFTPPDITSLGLRSTLYYAAVVLASVAGLLFFLLVVRSRSAPQPQMPAGKYKALSNSAPILVTGLVLLLLAGWPFWLTGTPIGLKFPPDRFTLPFMLGASLLVTGLVSLVPGKAWVRTALLAVLAGFAIGIQFQTSIAFMRDWNNQRSFFWQLAWRAPGLQPGTAVLANELPLKFVTDNSLSGPLNWIYTRPGSPEEKTLDQVMPYILYYPTIRVGLALPDLSRGHEIDQNYLATRFQGSTSQMAVVFFNRFACLRMLDPELEPDNMMIPVILREAARSSALDAILPDGTARPPTDIFGAEPDHGWCYYYEKAALAVQQRDWTTAAKLGDTAFTLDDHPNDPMERVPFIEAYAHVGKWDQALEQTRTASSITPLMQPMLCRLWDRIDRQSQPGTDKDGAVKSARNVVGCEGGN